MAMIQFVTMTDTYTYTVGAIPANALISDNHHLSRYLLLSIKMKIYRFQFNSPLGSFYCYQYLSVTEKVQHPLAHHRPVHFHHILASRHLQDVLTVILHGVSAEKEIGGNFLRCHSS